MPVEFRNIEVHSTWKIFPRHPASAEYPDLKKPLAQRMLAGIQEYGVMLRPVVLKREQGGMCVLDGWQMYQQCVAADLKPEFVELVSGIEPEKFVEIKNDHRRHETPQERAKRLRLRKVQVRTDVKNGKTVKQAAARAGVSVATATSDLRQPRCERCIAINATGDDCVRCQLLRLDTDSQEEAVAEGKPIEQESQSPTEPKPEAPPSTLDHNFVVVPDHVLDAFMAAGEVGHICRELDGILKRLNRLMAAKVGTRLISPTLPQRLADVRQHLWQTRATHVCPYCQGRQDEDVCTACRGQGWQSAAAFAQAPPDLQDAMRRIGARNVPI